MHAIGHMTGGHDVHLRRSGRRSAEVDPRYSSPIAENHRAAGQCVEVRHVSEADTRNISKPFHWSVNSCSYGSIEMRGSHRLLDILKGPLLAIQEFYILAGAALSHV